MKTNKYLGFLLAMAFLLGAGSCSEDKLDEIDTNPNSPEDVSINLLLSQVTINVPFAVANTDLAWYSSVFVQHTTGVHGQMQSADRRAGNEDATLVNNVWNNIYAGPLPDLNLIIEKGSDGGSESGRYHDVGIAKVLKAYTIAIATDAWGRVPYTEAGQGNTNRTPAYDTQQQIYTEIQTLLDEAIAEFAKQAPNPGVSDLIFRGDMERWRKTAYSLKARYHNRLSRIDPQGSATQALAAAEQGFQGNVDNFTFTRFTATAIGENPWFQERNDRSHHAVSETFVNLLTSKNDPRLQAMVAPAPNTGAITPAPNGTQTNDQANQNFSDVNISVLNATAPLPLMTYDELKFIEAESHLRLGNTGEAFTAYQEGIRAAMQRQINAPEPAIASYLSNASLPQSGGALTQEDIIEQKWIAFFYFQSIEAYNDWRRTGFPVLTHPIQQAPLRFPYPLSELDANAANVPNVQIYTDPVWWAGGPE